MTKNVNSSYASMNKPKAGYSLNLKRFNLGLLVVIAVTIAFYLVNINDLTVQGFVLHDLKVQASSLADANTQNKTMVNSVQSYNSLSSRVQKLNMVAVGDVDYLSVNHTSVARR